MRWLEDEHFKHWIRKNRNPVAICNCCSKDINVANMRKAALMSHMKGKKHVERSPLPSVLNHWCHQHLLQHLLQNLEPGNILECSNEGGQQKAINKLFIHAPTLEAEMRWVFSRVYSKYSMNSSPNSGKSFKAMFPDIEIAKLLQCGQSKVSYEAIFGLAPYFWNALLSTISNVPYYTPWFDGTLNLIFSKGQMDLLVWFWDDKADMVRNCYYGFSMVDDGL